MSYVCRKFAVKGAPSSGLQKALRIWVMTADAHIAKVYSKQGNGIVLTATIMPVAYEEERMSNESVGRVMGSSSSNVHHKYEPHQKQSQKEEIVFARDIATWLDTEATRDSFDRLVLVAAPHMLGELRKTISRPVYVRIMAEINKDLTKMDKAALQTELKKILWF